MLKFTTLAASAGILVFSTSAFAASDNPAPPPNAKKLSEIVTTIEKRDHFRFIKEIEWEDGGYYDITYYTTDNAKVEIKINAANGQAVGPS